MKVSLNWLKKYISIRVPVEELAERLTMAGLEVESVEDLGRKYDKFLVGEVLDVERHPDADKLTVCSVNVGRETLRIVCGAPNVARGLKVPVGLVGAVVPHNQHDPEGKPFVLERVTIREIESNGMICSEYELGLGSDADGILVLESTARVGTPLAQYLGLDDVVLEVAVTPNRPDCLSHLGIAREIGALFGGKLKKPAVKIREANEAISKWAKIEIKDVENCPRYTARIVRNVKVEASPKWLQDLLKAVGTRPVNNVVDVTNYVLLELGHPLHAFDYDKLEGRKIVVQKAKEGDTFVTLDGKERKLTSEMLMICDAVRPVAIAGVMGGVNTEISDTSTNVLIESAYFNPRNIRRTSKSLGLSTDASQRFERGADPNVTRYAVDRCAQLIQEICGGEVLKGVVDVYPRRIRPSIVPLRFGKVNDVLGTQLKPKQIVRILTSLEIIPKARRKGSGEIVCQIPTFRPDLEREIDLIEEVGRIYGYDNVETKMGTALKFFSSPPPEYLSDQFRNDLVGAGYFEVITNSLQKKSVALLSGAMCVEVRNPISEEMAALRTSLIPGVLEVVRHNIYHGTKDMRLFEIGNVFRLSSGGEKGKYFDSFVEEERLLVMLTGKAYAQSWEKVDRETDFYDLKGDIESLLKKIFLDKVRYIYYPTSDTLTEFSVGIEIDGTYVGSIGKVRNEILQQFGIEQDVWAAELSLELINKIPKRQIAFESLPKFPSVRRDLAFIVDETIPAADLEGAIRHSAGELLVGLRLFDLYRGDPIQQGKKSCAFSLEFLSRERTLTDDEVERTTRTIIEHVKRKLGAELRR